MTQTYPGSPDWSLQLVCALAPCSLCGCHGKKRNLGDRVGILNPYSYCMYVYIYIYKIIYIYIYLNVNIIQYLYIYISSNLSIYPVIIYLCKQPHIQAWIWGNLNIGVGWSHTFDHQHPLCITGQLLRVKRSSRYSCTWGYESTRIIARLHR